MKEILKNPKAEQVLAYLKDNPDNLVRGLLTLDGKTAFVSSGWTNTHYCIGQEVGIDYFSEAHCFILYLQEDNTIKQVWYGPEQELYFMKRLKDVVARERLPA